jgi:hypothetical protein
MPDFPTLADLGEDAELAAPPLPAESSDAAPPSRTLQILDWLAGEGFRARVDDDGDIHFRHEGRDVYVVLEPDDLSYLRLLVPGLWKCDDEAEFRVALAVANELNDDVKVAKVVVSAKGGVFASIELLLDGLETFRSVALRCLDLLGAARWEFRSRMRTAVRRAAEETATLEEALDACPACPDDVAGLP